MKFSFTAKNEPECKSFLEIRMPDGEYQPIDEFIKAQPAISEADLETCFIKYRGDEKTYKQDSDDYVAFSETMKFVNFIPPMQAVDAALLQSACANAKAKAEILTKASGVTLGELVSIDYNWGELHLYSPTRYEMDEACMMRASAAPTAMDIEPDDIDVSDSVTFVWEIK